MKSLFVDLFSYRQRENVSPLEDWLTECLASVLRALSPDQTFEVLGALCGIDPAALRTMVGKRTIAFQTQYVADATRRPDMVVLVGGKPWMVFENKVAHTLGKHERSDGEAVCQITGYADWLKAECLDDLPPALVFVTHLTAPPPGFDAAPREGDGFHGMRRHSTSWGAFARRLLKVARAAPDNSLAIAFGEALYGILEDQDMANEFPTSTHYAALELFLKFGGELENLVERMWSAVAPRFKFGATADYRLKPVFNESTFSAYRYFNKTQTNPSGNTFLQVGLCCPGPDGFITSEQVGQENVPEGLCAFVFYANDYDDFFENLEGCPQGWLRTASTDFVACLPLDDLKGTPDARGAQVIGWVEDQAGILTDYLRERKIQTAV